MPHVRPEVPEEHEGAAEGVLFAGMPPQIPQEARRPDELEIGQDSGMPRLRERVHGEPGVQQEAEILLPCLCQQGKGEENTIGSGRWRGRRIKRMKLIKRDGSEEQFDRAKIRAAIAKADAAAREEGLADVLDATEIAELADEADARCRALGRAVSVEEVQDFVEDALIDGGHPKLMQLYKNYRTKHELMRKENSTDGRILSLLERQNEEALQENSNKNPIINSTLRDYMAGEVSRDLCRRYFFAQDIIEAHDEGIIHLHDTDYISEPEHNCSLVNLEDMLQNGTVINGTMIEKPHSFATACNIATQIAAVVASSQYGGQTISLSHLAHFVDVRMKEIRAEVFADVCEE